MKTIQQFLFAWIASLSMLLFTQCQKTELTASPGNPELTDAVSARSMQHDEGIVHMKINNCIETILIDGEYKFIFEDFRVTPGNQFSLRSHYEMKGKGVGAKSGNQYEWINTGGKSFTGSFENGEYHQTYRLNERLIGHGVVPDSKFDISYTLRINANGEIVVDDFKFSSSCD